MGNNFMKDDNFLWVVGQIQTKCEPSSTTDFDIGILKFDVTNGTRVNCTNFGKKRILL